MVDQYRQLLDGRNDWSGAGEVDPGAIFEDVSNVKQEWNGTFIYLPEELERRMQLAFTKANLSYQRTSDRDLEKMREFYPLLIALGLDRLERLDGEALLAAISELDEQYDT